MGDLPSLPELHDEAVMGAGIHLSSELRLFLSQNAKLFDGLVEAGVLDRFQLDCVRAAAIRMEDARSARVLHALH